MLSYSNHQTSVFSHSRSASDSAQTTDHDITPT